MIFLVKATILVFYRVKNTQKFLQMILIAFYFRKNKCTNFTGKLCALPYAFAIENFLLFFRF